MKSTMTAQEIIAKHLKSDRLIESLSARDYKKNNSEAKKLDNLFRVIEQDINLAKEVYKELLASDCMVARLHSAAECLSLEIYIEEAIQVLSEMVTRTDIGIRSFSAEMCLKMWKKNGYHEMYPGQHSKKEEPKHHESAGNNRKTY
jgi:tagatose-1,6-bisphosphate aldolase